MGKVICNCCKCSGLYVVTLADGQYDGQYDGQPTDHLLHVFIRFEESTAPLTTPPRDEGDNPGEGMSQAPSRHADLSSPSSSKKRERLSYSAAGLGSCWVINGLGTSSRVCATGYIKDPVPLCQRVGHCVLVVGVLLVSFIK